MMSDNIQLQQRGFVASEDLSEAGSISVEKLYEMLESKSARDRSVAVVLLRKYFSADNQAYVKLLLDRLSLEKALYTRLEIGKSLEAGDEQTALTMCAYLGKVGNNQHRIIPNKISGKKGYPLPRDIIARIIGRMDEKISTSLFCAWRDLSRTQLLELLDGLGFLVFYHPEQAALKNFRCLLDIYHNYRCDELMVWKIVLCCSSFPLPESRSLLQKIRKRSLHETINLEIIRSLSLMERRSK